MNARNEASSVLVDDGRTRVERKSDRELVITRSFNAPARIVFEAWTTPELFKRWWVPKSVGMTMVSCEIDVRVGGTYRFVFAHPNFPEPMAFFGRYTDVTPPSQLVWTNEESGEGAISTLTFEERGGTTLLTLREVYPSRDAFEEAMQAGNGYPEQFGQLDELLVTLTKPSN